ncbi:MAG: hypothetical protein ACI92G_002690, partial [Candidatus Pelagisphaera sp.]
SADASARGNRKVAADLRAAILVKQLNDYIVQ